MMKMKMKKMKMLKRKFFENNRFLMLQTIRS